jgi:hypothetical protein
MVLGGIFPPWESWLTDSLYKGDLFTYGILKVFSFVNVEVADRVGFDSRFLAQRCDRFDMRVRRYKIVLFADEK